MNEMVLNPSNSFAHDYCFARRISNASADPSVLESEFLKLFREAGKEKSFYHLENFLSSTAFPPIPSVVYEKYAELAREIFFNQGKRDMFKNLMRVTGIKPNEDFIRALAMSHSSEEGIKTIVSALGIEVSSETIQRVYQKIFEEQGSIPPYVITGFEELPNSELVNRIYEKIIENVSWKMGGGD